jgi:hypothetical protein
MLQMHCKAASIIGNAAKGSVIIDQRLHTSVLKCLTSTQRLFSDRRPKDVLQLMKCILIC